MESCAHRKRLDPRWRCRGPVGRLLCSGLQDRSTDAKDVVTFLLWLLLFVLCWPIALLALLLYPIVWLLLLPFRLLGVAVEGIFELLRALILLPSRILRGKP